jgi:hypothetical protein
MRNGGGEIPRRRLLLLLLLLLLVAGWLSGLDRDLDSVSGHGGDTSM